MYPKHIRLLQAIVTGEKFSFHVRYSPRKPKKKSFSFVFTQTSFGKENYLLAWQRIIKALKKKKNLPVPIASSV